nr:DbpA RNA binding domain-containing protein [Gemmatimonadales bacterium]
MPEREVLQPETPLTSTLASLGWAADDPSVRDATATAARGHSVVVTAPPSPAYAAPALAGVLSRLGAGAQGLLLCPASELGEWGALVQALSAGRGLRVQVAYGAARALRRLRANDVDLLIADADTALTLLRRSALKVEGLAALVLAWPERWADDEALAPLMQDLPKDTQRLVLTTGGDQALAVVERYARKALSVGGLPTGSAPPLPTGPVRTVSVPWERRVAALADLVELLDPASLTVWTADCTHHDAIRGAIGAEPGTQISSGEAEVADTIIAFDVPTPDRLRQLLAAGSVVLLVPPGTEDFVARLAEPRRTLRLPGLLDAVTSAAGARRATIARAIDESPAEPALLVLAPLFERHDPASVAAALYELWTRQGSGVPAPLPDIPATSKVFVGVGKKDGATVNDLVAVLTKDVRVERTKIGRVELKDSFALVELPAQDAERIAVALNGLTIRRRRVTARIDRG